MAGIEKTQQDLADLDRKIVRYRQCTAGLRIKMKQLCKITDAAPVALELLEETRAELEGQRRVLQDRLATLHTGVQGAPDRTLAVRLSDPFLPRNEPLPKKSRKN